METENTTPETKLSVKDRIKNFSHDYGPTIVYAGLLSVCGILGYSHAKERNNSKRITALGNYVETLVVVEKDADGNWHEKYPEVTEETETPED